MLYILSYHACAYGGQHPQANRPDGSRWGSPHCGLFVLLQTAGIFFQPSFLTSADTAGAPLLGPLMQILSLGLSAAAVTNYVQSVSDCLLLLL